MISKNSEFINDLVRMANEGDTIKFKDDRIEWYGQGNNLLATYNPDGSEYYNHND